MEQVGYDTYCKLLDEVLKQMQGIEEVEEQDIQIDLAVSCYIPEEYIENIKNNLLRIDKILKSKNIPEPINEKSCFKCAYFELCYI